MVAGVEDVVELDPGDEDGVGSHSRLTWRSRLPYDLVFEARTRTVVKPHLIEAEADGELVGEGRWACSSRTGSPSCSMSGTSRPGSAG